MGIFERSGHRHLCAFILLLVAEEGGYGRRIYQRLAEAFPGFRGYPGYFRLAFCVDEAVIRGAAQGFAAVDRKSVV